MKVGKIPQSALIAGLAFFFLLVLVAGYFLLISPQRKKASELDKRVGETEQQITDARALSLKAKNTPKIRIADLFKLTKAMPDRADEAGILLEINEIARDTGISFDSISPLPAVVVSGYQAVPINLEFQGSFYDLSDFLFRVRNLVDVRRGLLNARGRLFAVDSITFDEGERLFPQIKASLTIDAFVFGTAVPATVPVAPAATPTSPQTSTTPGGTTAGPTTTSPTSTAPASTTSTPAPSAPSAGSAVAAGATP